jgi:hypothetical protein
VPADLANHAAAIAEGYVRVQIDYGPTVGLRYCSRYDGDAQSGALRFVEGWDTSSQANADTNALNALNGFRRSMFRTDGTNTNKGPRSSATLVPAKN